MQSVGLFVRTRDSKAATYVPLLSSNKCIFKDNLLYGDPYRRQLQSYYDGLVTNGIISFEGVDRKDNYFQNAFFKIKGIDDLQTVSNSWYRTLGILTIEELLILAANTNNLEYPKDFEPGTVATNLQKAGLYGAVALAGYGIVHSSPYLLTVFLTSIGKELISYTNENRTERPKPKLIDGATEIPVQGLAATTVVRPKLK